MSPRARLALLAAAAAASAAMLRPAANPEASPGPRRTDAFAAGKHRGVCYAHSMRRGQGYGSAASGESLRALSAMGAAWVSLTPFGFQRASDDTEIRWSGERISESDDRLRAATA